MEKENFAFRLSYLCLLVYLIWSHWATAWSITAKNWNSFWNNAGDWYGVFMIIATFGGIFGIGGFVLKVMGSVEELKYHLIALVYALSWIVTDNLWYVLGVFVLIELFFALKSEN